MADIIFYILLSFFGCTFSLFLPPVIPIQENGIIFTLDSLLDSDLNLFPGETISLRDGSITSVVRALNATEQILADENKSISAFDKYQIQKGETYVGSEREEDFKVFKNNILKLVEAKLKTTFYFLD